MRYGLYRESRPKVTGMSREIMLSSTTQHDDMPSQKGKPTREEWDRLSKMEQWELIKNMDLKEATKGMSDSERTSYIENLKKVSDAVDMGAGYRILHYVTISGYINCPNAILF